MKSSKQLRKERKNRIAALEKDAFSPSFRGYLDMRKTMERQKMEDKRKKEEAARSQRSKASGDYGSGKVEVDPDAAWEADKAVLEEALQSYLMELGKKLAPNFKEHLKTLYSTMKKEYEPELARMLYKGIIKSMEVNGFEAIEGHGKAAPYEYWGSMTPLKHHKTTGRGEESIRIKKEKDKSNSRAASYLRKVSKGV